MWPFRTRASPRRGLPAIPYVGGVEWAAGWGGTTAPLTPQACEALAAVASCTSLIAETIAALPCVVTLAGDNRKVQPENPLSRLVIEGCNPQETWSDLTTSLIASALLRGNGLAEVLSDARGQLSGLVTVPWQLCTPWQATDGALRFDYLPMSPPAAGIRRTLLRDDVVLLKDRSDLGVLGVPRLVRSGNAVQHALATQVNSFRWMANASKPGGTLNTPNKVSTATMDRLSQDWDSGFTADGPRFGKTAVLPEGLEFKPLGWLTSEDAQIVERLAYSVLDICRIFGVPNFLLGGEKTTFASANAALQYFAANTLRPWVVRLERSFQASVLTPDLRLQIDLTALLKADPDAFAAALLKLRTGGLVTANECRAMLGLPPHADGESLTPPSVMSGKAEVASDATSASDAPPPKGRMNGKANGHDKQVV